MAMPVMWVRKVWMRLHQGRMLMSMGMRFAAIPELVMLMLMVHIVPMDVVWTRCS